MKPFFSRYTELGKFLDDRPDFRADWKQLALLALAGFSLTLAVRLLEAANWDTPTLMAGSERILATHDSYCWLAGAKGVNEYAGFGMSGLARLLAAATGAPLWSVGFWTPPFLASLTAVVTALWGWLLAGRHAAILPGLTGALAPAFYYRSRVGYFDSDVFTLLMPLLLGLLLALVIAPCCTRAWSRSAAEDQEPAPVPAWLPWLALCFGLVARVAHFAHDDIHPLGVGLYWLALGLALVTALPGRRAKALSLLVVYGLAAYAGPRRFGVEVFELGLLDTAGLALTACVAWLCWKRPAHPAWLARFMDHPWLWLAILAAMTLACGLLLPFGPFWAKVLNYFKPVADAGLARLASGEAAPSYPGITQSIREAKNVADFGLLFAGTSFTVLGGAAGFLGILALLLLRPACVLLLPITLLGFASLKLGARFAMFGGPVFALGLGIGLYWLCKALARRLGRGERTLPWVQAGLGLVIVLIFYGPRYAETRPTPVLGPAHALALLDLRQTAPKDATVWTWWDYGYATQYYAERPTPSDGGRHAGRDIYATALALTTDSYRQAAQVIRLAAAEGGDPAKRWDTMPAGAVKQELEGLRERDLALPGARPQLFTVCWENLPLLYWISFYGTWDVVAGTGRHAGVMQIAEAMDVDKVRGELSIRSKKTPLPLASAEVFGPKGRTRVQMAEHPGGPHLVVNELSRQALLLDDEAYNSMAVQLLLGDPGRPELVKYFKLLHEGFPLVRIYEVLSGPVGPAAQAKAAKP
jgi:hypothetical protein